MKPEQITAWALDEASAEEREQLEAALQENPQDKVKAEETKAFCDFLLSELRDDSLALTDKQRERLVAQAKQPVGQSSRLPDASETLAPQPEAGGKAAKTTRWNFGVIVRLSLAACAVLGGFWTWQAYSSRRSEARAVAVVTDKPGIKVQLAKKPEPKKGAGQGPETRLLAAAPAKPVIVAEQPVAKTLPPAALADAGAMTFQPAKRAEAEKLRQMTESHSQEYRQLVAEAQKLQKLAQDPSLPADLRGTYAAELNVKTKAVRALEKEMQERSDAKPQTAALVLNKDQHAMTPADLERLKRVQDEKAYGLSFGGVMAGMPPAAEPQMSLAAGGVAAAGSLGQMGMGGGMQKTEPVAAGTLLALTSSGTMVRSGSAMVRQAQGRGAQYAGPAFMSAGGNLDLGLLNDEYDSRTGRLTLFTNHWISFEGIWSEPWLYSRWQLLAPMGNRADSLELVFLPAGAALAEYQSSLAFGSPSIYGPWLNSVGEAWLVLTAANASSGSIVVQAGAPLTAHAALQAIHDPLPHFGTVPPLSSLWYNCYMSFHGSFSIHPSFPLKPELNANSPGLITFATAASVPFNAAHERGGHLAEEMSVSDGRGMQAAVNAPVKAERRADVHATGGLNGAVPGLLDIAGGEIQNDPFKVRSSRAGVGHDFVPPSLSFGYSFIHNMGSLAGGGGFNSFSGGFGGYGMNDMQQLTLGANTPLGSGRLALSASDELSNGNVATVSGVDTNGTRTPVSGAPVALETTPQVVEFDGYVNYGSLILGSSAGSGKVSSSGPVSGVQPAAASKPVFASVGAQEPMELGEIGEEGKALLINGGMVRLTGGNTYTGATVVHAGTLNVTGGNAIQLGDASAASSVRGYMRANAPVTFSGALTLAGAAPADAPPTSPAGIVGGWATTDQEVATFNNTAQGLQNNVGTTAGSNVNSATVAPAAPLVMNPEPVAKVQAGLELAASSTELGNYDTAIAQYQNVLRTDPYNAAARRGMESAEKKRQEYFKAAYDHKRAKMLAEVSETWETKVPVVTQAGSAVVFAKDGKTDDFYFGRNTMPEERKAERPSQPSAGESYTRIIENEMKEVAREPLSTLSIDVDTASYANVRRFFNQNMLPPPDAVRIEELVNYFPTSEEGPAHEAKEPFAVRVELAPCPWQPVHRLARISIKGREMDKDRKASNLVFLVDVSGSMGEPLKLPLVQQSLRMLTEQLGEGDRVTMVVYAGNSGLVLPPTSGEKKAEILAAIDRLQAGGSTHGSAGIQLAYEQAVAGFIKGGVNRVILCTDGDFNVGVSSPEELEKLIKHKAKTGVFLSVLGFGSGNLKDRTMETLADKGNGNYAYIDSLSEARKVLVEQMSGTLDTIAKDVKIQVEFNPAAVRSYRLIGYENRVMAKEDFNDDTKDAGEIGAGHSVVALYEVVPANLPAGAEGRPAVDSLKYQAPAISPAQLAEAAKSGETMTVKLRYKEPDSDLSKLIEMPVKDAGHTLTASTEEFKFSAAVAGFGLLLRDSSYKGTLGWETVRRLALDGKGADKLGYRGEFLQLIDKARGLKETRQQ